MLHMQKTKTQFVKKGAAGGSFLNTLVSKLPFEMYLPGHNFSGLGTKFYKKIESGWNAKGVEYINK